MIKKFLNLFSKEKIENTLFWITLFTIIIVGLILRIKIYLFNQSFWLDEGSLGISIIDRKYEHYFKPLYHYQVAPPFFMVLSKFLLTISRQAGHIYYQDMVLRFIPFISGCLALPLFSYLAHKIFNNKYLILISSAIFSFNDVAIIYCQQFKQYSSDLLFSLVLLLIFLNFDINKLNNKKLALYSLFFSLCPWCSNTTLFILASGFLIILIDLIINYAKDKVFPKAKLLILFSPFFVSFALFAIYHHKICKHMYEFMLGYWLSERPSFFTSDDFFSFFTGKMQELIAFFDEKYLILYIVACLIILFNMIAISKNYKKEFKKPILILLPIILTIMASFLKKYPYDYRLILFLLPMFALLYSQIAFIINKTKTNHILICLILLFFSFNQLSVKPESKIRLSGISREMFLDIQKENPEFKNVLVSYNCDAYYAKLLKIKYIFISPVADISDKKTKANVELNNLPLNQDSYFVCTNVFVEHNICKEFIDYANKNNKIFKIKEIKNFPPNHWWYVIKFQKIK